MSKPIAQLTQEYVAAYAPCLVPPSGWEAMTYHQVWLYCLQELSDYESNLDLKEAEDWVQQVQAALYHKHRKLFKARFPTSTALTLSTPWDHSTIWFGNVIGSV